MPGVLKSILQSVTPEKVKKEIEAIKRVEIPPYLLKWVKEYEEIGERDRFVWKLFLKTDREVDYTNRVKSYQKSLQEVRFLITMFEMLVDDVSDQDQNRRLLKKLLEIPFMESSVSSIELNQKENCLKFTLKIWARINRLLSKSPQYQKLKEIFIFDIKQMMNAMEYSYLINKNPFLINETEYWLYPPHTMQLIIGNIVEIMFLPRFNICELGAIREISWQALKMARIGNCLSTWEREIYDSDYTSGVFAYAISSDIISPKDLFSKDKSVIIGEIKDTNIESELLKEWKNGYREISNLAGKTKTINIQKFLHSLEKLLLIEIIRKKYK